MSERSARVGWSDIVRPFHVLWIASIIVPQIIAVIILKSGMFGFINSLAVFMWLFIPCADKNFGNKARLFYVRQTVFVVGGIMVIAISLLV